MPVVLSERDSLVERHRAHCRYNGAGAKKWPRPNNPNHKGRGAFKHRSENNRIIQCGRRLYSWCKELNTDPTTISSWQDLSPDQLPKDDGAKSRCVTIEP